MFHLLDKVRRKSEPERKMYAALITTALTVLIFGVWLSVVTTKGISDPTEKVENEKEAGREEFASENSPINSIKENAANLYEDFKVMMGEIKKTTEDIQQEVGPGAESTTTGSAPDDTEGEDM